MGQLSSSFCVSPCTVTAAANAFILSSDAPTGQSTVATSCLADFLIFVGGTSGISQADRYCGERFNPVGGTTSAPVTANAASVCSKFRKAEIHFNGRFTNLIYFFQLRLNHTNLSTKRMALKLQLKLTQTTMSDFALLTPSHRREQIYELEVFHYGHVLSYQLSIVLS